MRTRMRLPHNETDGNKLYSMPDPDALVRLHNACRDAYYGYSLGAPRGKPTDEQMAAVFALAGGYLDLTTYELGQECCVRKLRDIWRARRAHTTPAVEREKNPAGEEE